MPCILPVFDAHYVIGSGHHYCQDYATSGNNYAIISDGCSGSPHSDIGARLLAHRAAHIIKCYSIDVLSDPMRFGTAVIKMAKSAVDQLDIDSMCLDATLMVIHIVNECIVVDVFGDGVVYVKTTNGNELFINIKYTPEMPGYLSYLLSNSRREAYLREAPKKTVTHTTVDPSGSVINTEEYKGLLPMQPDSYSWALSEVEYVAIFSDGVTTYYDANKRLMEELPYQQMVRSIINTPNSSDGFLRRRMIRVEKESKKDNVLHYDDLSSGVVKCLISE